MSSYTNDVSCKSRTSYNLVTEGGACEIDKYQVVFEYIEIDIPRTLLKERLEVDSPDYALYWWGYYKGLGKRKQQGTNLSQY